MDPLDLNTILGIALGYLIASLVRHLQRSRFWDGVRKIAGKNLADPNVPVNDAHEAAERALLDAQASKVNEVARSITTIPPAISRTRTLEGVAPSKAIDSDEETTPRLKKDGDS